MKAPTTIKGYLKLLDIVRNTHLYNLRGFENYPKEKQEDLGHIIASIDNIINEW